MKHKIANFISVIGHPLLTIPLFVSVVMFGFEDFGKASFISLLIIGCIFVPIILWMFFKSRNGSYTNFDVSDRNQRKSVFVFIIPFMLVVTAILFFTRQSQNLCISVLCATILIIFSQVLNLFIKSSLHVSLNIYLSFLVMPINFAVGILIFILTGFIGWSRIELGRHTLKEVLTGAGAGLIISLLMLQLEGKLF